MYAICGVRTVSMTADFDPAANHSFLHFLYAKSVLSLCRNIARVGI